MSDRDDVSSFAGVKHASLRDQVERTSASERVHHLEMLLELARTSGALAFKRQRERLYWERIWNGNSSELKE